LSPGRSGRRYANSGEDDHMTIWTLTDPACGVSHTSSALACD